MTRSLLAFSLAVAFTAPSLASAEDRPAVFIHGLASSSHTWDQAVTDLTPLLAIQPYSVDLDWRAFYETQAAQVQQQVGSLPGAPPRQVGPFDVGPGAGGSAGGGPGTASEQQRHEQDAGERPPAGGGVMEPHGLQCRFSTTIIAGPS